MNFKKYALGFISVILLSLFVGAGCDKIIKSPENTNITQEKTTEYWVNRIKNNESNPLSVEELSNVPDEAWYEIVPQVIRVIKNDGVLGGSNEAYKEFTCLADECTKLIGKQAYEPILGYSVATGYKTTLRTSMTVSQSYIPVSSMLTKDGTTLTTSDLGGKVFLTVEPGANKEEISKCIDNTATNWTSCTRGLAFSGTTETAVAENAETHNAGSIVVMSNVHYVYEQLTDIDTAQTITAPYTFTSTSPNIYYTFPLVSSTAYTGLPTTNGQLATKYYVDTVGAGGFTALNASTTQGVRVFGTSPETLGVNVSTTKGMTIGTDGAIYQKASSTSGILQDSNGMYLDSSYVVLDSDTTSTPTASKIPIADASGNLYSWVDLPSSATTGTLLYWGGSSWTGLTTGTLGYVLSQGNTSTPEWIQSRMLGFDSYFMKSFNYSLDITGTDWTKTNCAFTASGAVGWSDIQSSDASWLTYGFLPGTSTLAQLLFADGKDITVEFRAKATNGTTGHRRIGFGSGWNKLTSNSADSFGIMFSVSTTVLYATNVNQGVGITNTQITGITVTNWNNYKIVYDNGVSAKFYVNGILKAIHTDNFPDSSNSVYFGLGGTANTEDWLISQVSITQEM